MKIRVLLLSVSVGIALGVAIATGYIPWWTDRQVEIYLYPVDELPQGQRGEERIYGGRPAKSGEFAASFYFKHDSGPCTATLIGPAALFTAAHCIPKGDIWFELGGGSDGGGVGALCSHAPEYPKEDETADYALCRLNSAIASTPYFETINTKAHLLASGQTVLLTGYGCTEDGNSQSAYYVGDAAITGAYQPDINEFRTDGKALLCYGDSGGPAFRVDQRGRRVQIAVNAFFLDEEEESILLSVTSPIATGFLERWSERHGVEICGMHEEAPKCNGVE